MKTDISEYLPLTVWAKSSSGVSPKNGAQPIKNSYKIIPIDHQSTGLPYPCLEITLGCKINCSFVLTVHRTVCNTVSKCGNGTRAETNSMPLQRVSCNNDELVVSSV